MSKLDRKVRPGSSKHLIAQPDYTGSGSGSLETKERLYREVASYLLETVGPFTLGLPNGVDDQNPSSLPSWVPDFADRLGRHPISSEPPGKSKIGLAFPYEIGEGTLSVQAAKVDSFAGHNFPNMPIDDGQSMEALGMTWLKSYADFVEALPREQREEFADAWWRLPICNRQPNPPHLPLHKSASWMTSFERLIAEARGAGPTSTRLYAINYSEYAFLMTMGRVPFVTAFGRVGMGPRTLQAGDELFVVAGAQKPLVLRRTGAAVDCSEYRLVDEAYVYGLELLDSKKAMKGRRDVRTISLV
jgi:hypothetical protein